MIDQSFYLYRFGPQVRDTHGDQRPLPVEEARGLAVPPLPRAARYRHGHPVSQELLQGRLYHHAPHGTQDIFQR